MAGKPEQPISHPASQSRVSYQHQQKSELQYNRHNLPQHNQQQQHNLVCEQSRKEHPISLVPLSVDSSLSDPTKSAGCMQRNQEATVSLYGLRDDKFPYATSAHQNDVTVRITENFQDQLSTGCRLGTGVRQKSVTTGFPINNLCYNVDASGRGTLSNGSFDESPQTVDSEEIDDREARYELVDRCKVLSKPYRVLLSGNNATREQRRDEIVVSAGAVNAASEIREKAGISIDTIGNVTDCSVGNVYRDTRTGHEITLVAAAEAARLLEKNHDFSESASPSQSERDESLSGKSDDDLSTITTTGNNLRIDDAGVKNRQDNIVVVDYKDYSCNDTTISRNHVTLTNDNIAFTNIVGNPNNCNFTIANESNRIVSELPRCNPLIGNTRSSSSSCSSDSGTISTWNSAINSNNRRITYSRRNSNTIENCKIINNNRRVTNDDNQEIRNREKSPDNDRITSRRCDSAASLDIVESSSISNSSNCSKSSENSSSSSSSTGSSSGRSSVNLLDNHECNTRSDSVVSATNNLDELNNIRRSIVQVIPTHQNNNNNNNLHLPTDASSVTLSNNQQLQQQIHQRIPSISEPRGWKRINTNSGIIYISPNSTALGSLGQLKEYLTTSGTCKCGLECPLRPERVFNFDPKVATRPWSPERGKTQEMNKLCNHKRKVLSIVGAAASSPVASCTPNVSSIGVSVPIRSINVSADSPNSTDFSERLRKDGLSKKRKRRLESTGSRIYSGVTPSQNVSQRNLTVVNDPSVPRVLQPSLIPKNSQALQGWPGGMVNPQFQQINHRISHQSSINSGSNSNNTVNVTVNPCDIGSVNHALDQQAISGMLVGNPLLINHQNVCTGNLLSNQHHESRQRQHQQITMQQIEMLNRHQNQSHHDNIVTNQLKNQQHDYNNQLHSLQPQQQQMEHQQIHVQHNIHGNNIQQDRLITIDTSLQHQRQQQNQNYAIRHGNETFIHLQASDISNEICGQLETRPIHQYSIQQQQPRDSLEKHGNYKMDIQQEQLSSDNYETYSMNLPKIVDPSIETTMDSENMITRNFEDKNNPEKDEERLIVNNRMQLHKIIDNDNSLQKINTENQLTSLRQQNSVERMKLGVKIVTNPEGPNSPEERDEIDQSLDVQSQKNSTKSTWQQKQQQIVNRNNQTENNVVYQNDVQGICLTVPDITCNSIDRVPPLHHHIPPVFTWTDQIAKKKVKSGKASNKKQRQYHVANVASESQNGIIFDQSSCVNDKFERFDEFKTQNDNQIGVMNNKNSLSFLDDPSGYLAQQTALLNSTISRQTGVTISQIKHDMNKKRGRNDQTEIVNNISNIDNSTIKIYVQNDKTLSPNSSIKNPAASPVFVDSSGANCPNNPDNDYNQSGYSNKPDTQSSYAHEDDSRARLHHFETDQREDPAVTSSTFAERFPTVRHRQNRRHHQQQQQQHSQIDPRPIQGGTVSTSHGSPVGSSSTGSPINSDSPPNLTSSPCVITETTNQQCYAQSTPPYSYSTSSSAGGTSQPGPFQAPLQHQISTNSQTFNNSLTPVTFETAKPHRPVQELRKKTIVSQYPTTSSVSSSISPSPSPSQTFVSVSNAENVPSHNQQQQHQRQANFSGYHQNSTTRQIISNQRETAAIQRGSLSSTSTVVTTMASGHTFSSNTITSVLAGRANTATVSINAPSTLPNSIISNISPHVKSSLLQQQQHQQHQHSNGNYSTGIILTSNAGVVGGNPSMIGSNLSQNSNVSKSPLEMVQSVVSSIQVPQTSSALNNSQHIHQHHHNQHNTGNNGNTVNSSNNNSTNNNNNNNNQSNIQIHNVLTTTGSGILKHAAAAAASLPPGHILVSSGGQLIMASTGGSSIGNVMPPPQGTTKIMSNGNTMPPLSVSPMVTNVSGTVNQVIPPVGVTQHMIGQPTVLVNTIQAPVIIQPAGVMTMDGIGQNVQIPHLTMTTGNVLQNSQTIVEANNQDRNINTSGQNIVNRQNTTVQTGILNETTMNKKKSYKKRKNNSQTVASMLHIASSQQNAGMIIQSQSNFAQQNYQTQSLGTPMLQALTIVPGKAGAPAQLVMNSPQNNGQNNPGGQFNTQQIIGNSQAAAAAASQQINLLQPVNLLSGATGMVQNFPTIQQFIVPGLGSMVMSTDGTATLLQDTSNIGMQLQIQNVNGQNVLTPLQSHGNLFSPGQSILTTGHTGMVIRTPQTTATTNGKIIQQQTNGPQFLSSNNGQFLVNGSTSFGNQLSPIVASVNPNQQVTFNTSQVRPTQGLQTQQEFIQMNGHTLVVGGCAPTSQNIAVSSAPANQQNTTFVQQNTTIVQQQTTMQLSNSHITDYQNGIPTTVNNRSNERSNNTSIDNNQSYIINSGLLNRNITSKNNAPINSTFYDNRHNETHHSTNQFGQHNSIRQRPKSHNYPQQQQHQETNNRQHSIGSGTHNNRSGGLIIDEKRETGEFNDERYSPSMVRHSVSTQTAAAAAAAANQTRQSGSPPDTTTHSPGNSQRSNSPAVDTTTHGAASPASPVTSRHRTSSSCTPMVHCITSSEPDSVADVQATTGADWRIQGGTQIELKASQTSVNQQQQQHHHRQQQQQQHDGKTYVESTVTTGIQIYASETTKQPESAMSTMRCEGRGMKRKLDSIHNMHSILHEDHDVSVDEEDSTSDWKLEVGQLVWGAALGSSAWPGKVEIVGPRGSSTVGVRWYGAGAASGLTHVQIKTLKSLSEGLEEHHRASKRVRKSRKLNIQLENAIQEAMTELDRYSEKESTVKTRFVDRTKIEKKANSRPGKSSSSSNNNSSSSSNNASNSSTTRDDNRGGKKFVLTEFSAKPMKKPNR